MKKQWLLFFVSLITHDSYGLDCAKACFRKKVKRFQLQHNELAVVRPEPQLQPQLPPQPQPLPKLAAKSADWAAIDVLVKELQRSEKDMTMLGDLFEKPSELWVQALGGKVTKGPLEEALDKAGRHVHNSVKQLDDEDYKKFLSMYFSEAYYALDKEEQDQFLAPLPAAVAALVNGYLGYLWAKGKVMSRRRLVSPPNPDRTILIEIQDVHKRKHIVAELGARAVVGADIRSLRIVDQQRLQELWAETREALVPVSVSDVPVAQEDGQVVVEHAFVDGIQIHHAYRKPPKKKVLLDEMWLSQD